MGWHTRHASTPSGLEGHLRPETLNLTAWNHALGLNNTTSTQEINTCIGVLYYVYIHIYVYIYNMYDMWCVRVCVYGACAVYYACVCRYTRVRHAVYVWHCPHHNAF